MFLVFWTLRFKPTFSLSSCNVIKRPFSSSSLSATRVLSSACLTLLLFLPAILISACASFSPEFLIMCSAYTSNKQGDQTQPWRTAFPIWSQSVVSCPLLTLASSPASSFLKCLDFVNLVSMYLFICLLKLFCKALFVPLGPIDSFLFLSSEIFNYNLFKNFSYHIFFCLLLLGLPYFDSQCVWFCYWNLWDYPPFFSYFLCYIALQQSFPGFFPPAQQFVRLLPMFCYWFLLQYF